MDTHSVHLKQSRHSHSYCHSNAGSVSSTIATNTISPEKNPRHNSNNGGCSCTDYSSLSERPSRFQSIRQVSTHTLPRYGYPAEDHSTNYYLPRYNPSAVRAIEKEAPDVTVQSLPIIALKSVGPLIPSTSHASDATGSPCHRSWISTHSPSDE